MLTSSPQPYQHWILRRESLGRRRKRQEELGRRGRGQQVCQGNGWGYREPSISWEPSISREPSISFKSPIKAYKAGGALASMGQRVHQRNGPEVGPSPQLTPKGCSVLTNQALRRGSRRWRVHQRNGPEVDPYAQGLWGSQLTRLTQS